MLGYPYITELFTGILAKSIAINGRAYMCPNWGREMNSDELGQVMQDLVIPAGLQKKYPLSLIMPPMSQSDYSNSQGTWDEHRFTLFFLTSTYYSGTSQPKSPNINTKTSTHSIPEDWHDMKRVAVSFMRVIRKVSFDRGLIHNYFRLNQERPQVITPVSLVGVDKASGVRLDFMGSLFTGCAIEDYNAEDIAAIGVPNGDTHPQHTL